MIIDFENKKHYELIYSMKELSFKDCEMIREWEDSNLLTGRQIRQALVLMVENKINYMSITGVCELLADNSKKKC